MSRAELWKNMKILFIKTIILSASLGILIYSPLIIYYMNKMLQGDNWDAVWLSWSEDPKTTMTISWHWGVERRGYVLYWNSTHRGVLMLDRATKLFHVTLRGLKPGGVYYYVIGYFDGDRMVNWSEPEIFMTAPAEPGRFRVLVHTDTHAPRYLAFERFIEAAMREDFDFIIHCGDMVDFGAEYCWSKFLEVESKIARNHPLMTVVGNHEIMYGGSENYFKFMTLPGNEYWYSFVYGNAVFVVLNVSSYNDFVFPESEREMFIEMMKYADEHNMWKIVCLHIPPLEIFPQHAHPDAGRILLPLFSRYRPHLVIMGHTHSYARLTIEDTTYIIVGSSGGIPNMAIYNEDSVDHYEFKHGYMILDVTNESILITYKDLDGNILDTYRISYSV